jgi:hypothetical protein
MEKKFFHVTWHENCISLGVSICRLSNALNSISRCHPNFYRRLTMLTKNRLSRRKLLQAGAAAAAAATLSSFSLGSFAGQYRGKEIVIG